MQINSEKVKEVHKAKAKVTRDCHCNCNIEVFGVLWQVDTVSRGLMNDAITTYKCLVEIEEAKPIDQQVPVTNLTNWILADNSIRFTTVEELIEILCQYSLRVNSTFIAYNSWRAGDCLQPFTI